jgi:hypothetical protein
MLLLERESNGPTRAIAEIWIMKVESIKDKEWTEQKLEGMTATAPWMSEGVGSSMGTGPVQLIKGGE